jgi:hypothetical protein
MPQLRDVHLSVAEGKIYINPDSLKVQAGDVVRFIVDTLNTTFEIAIHNFDQYLTDSRTIIVDSTSNGAPVSYTVNNSVNLVRYYSICVLGITPPPAQPDAPPRIIRTVISS